MLISLNWLKEYVPLAIPADELAMRLMMAGLNHEQSQPIGDDIQIELEVTSNRPDCLGHLGVAREASVLYDVSLTMPAAQPPQGKTPIADLVSVSIDCPELCPRYIARVVRGVRIGPSPAWLVNRLKTIGIASINNVVDVSNYVMMECGQPLHTFDYGKLRGPKIIVRTPHAGEKIEAIDHKTYALEPGMCVISDAERAAAIAGVMGGAESEVTPATRDILIESADFDPMTTRTTARRLNLHSDSSYRFERKVDAYNLDWASRRCAELILRTAGGELAAGAIDVGMKPPARLPVTLRLGQLKRILGIDVDEARVRQILVALGCTEEKSRAVSNTLTFAPPTWRRDLSREIDFVEEVARIHGYDKIPEDVSVPMAPSARRREDRIISKIRGVLTGAGYDEAMTLSAVDEASADMVKIWTAGPPLRSLMPVLRGADHLRTSLLPSLLAVRRTNESLSNPVIELFEIAKVYLPAADASHEGNAALPQEWLMLGISSAKSYADVRGVIEAILETLNPKLELQSLDADEPFVDPAMSCRLTLGGELLGYLGRVSPQAAKRFELRGPSMVAEIRLGPLFSQAELTPQYLPQTPYPAVSRDLNLVVNESVRWAMVAEVVRAFVGPDLEQLDYRDTYRDPERLGPGRKSLLFSFSLRSQHGTLTSQAADEVRDRIVAACRERLGAELR
jgi:phenylalanyl-tRNA synthetase beta chain